MKCGPIINIEKMGVISKTDDVYTCVDGTCPVYEVRNGGYDELLRSLKDIAKVVRVEEHGVSLIYINGELNCALVDKRKEPV